MGHVSFADLIARRVPLAASEAASLALAVARLMDARRVEGQRVRLPDDEWILLSSSGEVSIVEVHGSADLDETAGLSALLRRLLRLDERLPSSGHDVVPGGLLIVLARNLGYIHLPATGPDAFRAALERFAAANPAVLAAVFWRAAASRPARLPRGGAATRACDARNRFDRRQQGPSRADLRRALRDLEGELFEMRARFSAPERRVQRSTRLSGHHAVAAVLAACFIGAVAVASLAVPGDSPQQSAVTHGDVMLRPAAAIVPGVRRIAPATRSSAASDGAATRPAPGRPSGRAASPPATPRAGVRHALASSAPAATRAGARSRQDAPPPAKPKKDPLAVHRGGTRGIPFALPPG